MHIVFVTTTYLPHIGGIEIYISEFVQYFVNNNYYVTVIVADKTCKNMSKERIGKKTIIRLPAFEIRGFFLLKSIKELDIIDKTISRADIVHLNACKFLYEYLAKKKQEYGYRLIVTSHGWLYHTQKNKLIKNLYFKHIIAKYASNYDGIINVSKQDQMIAQKFGVKNSCIIENGVDIYKYAGLKQKDYYEGIFIYWGRIASNKGIYECLKKLSVYDYDYKFYIIGTCDDKKYKRKLDEYILKSGIENKVYFLGTKTDNEIRLLMEKADFILLPSLHEGFGMTLVECLLSGRRIIANTNSSFISILNNVGAKEYLFDFESKNTYLKDKIDELLNQKRQIHNVEQYSIENMIGKTMEIYGI